MEKVVVAVFVVVVVCVDGFCWSSFFFLLIFYDYVVFVDLEMFLLRFMLRLFTLKRMCLYM